MTRIFNQIVWIILWFLSIQVWSAKFDQTMNVPVTPTSQAEENDVIEEEKISDDDAWELKVQVEVKDEGMGVKINIVNKDDTSLSTSEEEEKDQIFRKIEPPMEPFDTLHLIQRWMIKKGLSNITPIILSYLKFAPIFTKLVTHGGVYNPTLTRDGRWLLWGYENMNILNLTDTTTGLIVNQFFVGQESVMMSPNGERRASILEKTEPVYAMAIADNHSFLVGGGLTDVWIWETMSKRVIKVLTGHTAKIVSCRIFRDDTRIVTGSEDWTARVWTPTKSECLCVLRDHTNAVHTCVVSIDNLHIVSLSSDQTMRVWNSDTGDCQHVLPVNVRLRNGCVAVVDNEQCVGLITEDGNVELWNIAVGERTKQINMDATKLFYVSKDRLVWYDWHNITHSVNVLDFQYGYAVRIPIDDDFIVEAVRVTPDNQHLMIVGNKRICVYPNFQLGRYYPEIRFTAHILTYDFKTGKRIDIK